MDATPAFESGSPTVTSIVGERLRPLVQRIDIDGYYPAEVLHGLGEAGAYARHTTALGDGPGGIVAAIDAMADDGATCLSTAFCMWRQDALVWYLDHSENRIPRANYLQAVATGRLLGGTGLSNPMKALAGLEPPALKGRRVSGGYRVTGRLPFVSNMFTGIFLIENTENPYGMAVFKVGDDGVGLARNAHFIALEGTATNSVLIRDAFVPDDDLLSDDAVRFVYRIRKGFVLLQAGMAIGVARGAARLMRQDDPVRRYAVHLPLGPDAIEARADALIARASAHVRLIEETDRASCAAHAPRHDLASAGSGCANEAA